MKKIKYFNILIFVFVGWECNCYGTTIEIFAQQTSKQSPCQIITENYINFQTTPPLHFVADIRQNVQDILHFSIKSKSKKSLFLSATNPVFMRVCGVF